MYVLLLYNNIAVVKTIVLDLVQDSQSGIMSDKQSN